MGHNTSPLTEKRILFFTCAAHALTHVYMVAYTVVLTQLSEEFGVDRIAITRYATISIVLFGLGAIPAGWLGDRLGEKNLLVTFFVMSALGGLLVGLAQDLYQLAIGMGILGLGTSIFHPVGNAFIARGVRNPGRAMGTNGLWGNVGEALGPFLTVQIALLASWRWAYISLALPTLALGLWLALTKIQLEDSPAAPPKPTRGKFPGVLILLLLAMTCGGFQFWIIKTMLPSYLQEGAPSSWLPDTLRGGYLASLIYLIGGLGQLLAGRLVHHREGRGLYVVIFALSVPIIYAVGKISGHFLFPTACVMAILMFSAQPIENVLLVRYSPRGLRGLIFGLKFTLAFGIGGLGASFSGTVEARYGLGEVFTMAAAFTAVALALALAAFCVGRKPKTAHDG